VRALRGGSRQADLQRLDYAAAVLVTLDIVLEAALENSTPHRLATALFAVALGAMIALRRRRPAVAVIGCSCIALAQEPFHGQLFSLDSEVALFPFALCAYGAGAWLPWRRGLAVTAVAVAVLIVDQVIQKYVTEVGTSGGLATGVALSLILFGVPWIVGRFIAERRRRADAFAALAEQTEAEQAQRAQTAIEQERMAIGRELQDIIAHSVSVMVVQAGGARRLLAADPDRARASILTVEQTGRQTLAEMRRLLGLLRSDDDPAALAPQPGLDRLGELVGTVARGGLICALATEGEPVALTPGIDLVAYRVIEAALARAAQARCAAATALVRYAPGWLELEVNGDRPVPGTAAELAAVRERVDLYGGRVDVDLRGPFAVRCRLPLDVVAAS
jgi:signal transduction histidine kinase